MFNCLFFFFGKAVASGRPWLSAAWDTTRNKCSCRLQRQVTANQNRSAPGRAEAPLSNQSKMDFYLCVGPFIGGLLISSQLRAMNIPLWDKLQITACLFKRGGLFDCLFPCWGSNVGEWDATAPRAEHPASCKKKRWLTPTHQSKNQVLNTVDQASAKGQWATGFRTMLS